MAPDPVAGGGTAQTIEGIQELPVGNRTEYDKRLTTLPRIAYLLKHANSCTFEYLGAPFTLRSILQSRWEKHRNKSDGIIYRIQNLPVSVKVMDMDVKRFVDLVKKRDKDPVRTRIRDFCYVIMFNTGTVSRNTRTKQLEVEDDVRKAPFIYAKPGYTLSGSRMHEYIAASWSRSVAALNMSRTTENNNFITDQLKLTAQDVQSEMDSNPCQGAIVSHLITKNYVRGSVPIYKTEITEEDIFSPDTTGIVFTDEDILFPLKRLGASSSFQKVTGPCAGSIRLDEGKKKGPFMYEIVENMLHDSICPAGRQGKIFSKAEYVVFKNVTVEAGILTTSNKRNRNGAQNQNISKKPRTDT